MKPNTS